MAHTEQIKFCKKIQAIYPEYFREKKVLDCGSMDINGNNRYLFKNCDYLGIDVKAGPNVGRVCPIHHFKEGQYVTIICTEVLEHDPFFRLSLINMKRLLNLRGLLIFTCATTGRAKHRVSPCGYYRNVTVDDIWRIPGFIKSFEHFDFEFNTDHNDLFFWGIKKSNTNEL